MTNKEKQLLLKDLCTRLPYGVKCAIFDNTLPFGGARGKYPFEMDGISIEENEIDVWLVKGNFNLETIRPYLRPMSSMTEEEENEYRAINCYEGLFPCNEDALDYVLSNHFDFRCLIPIGLALEAPMDMYKTE